MRIVFPSHPVLPGRPDAAFEAEVRAAREAGFEAGFAGLELHFGGELELRLPKGGGPALYRGWILRLDDYARLEAALAERGWELVNTAAAYRHCFLFPEWYSALGADVTPRSIWFPGSAFDLGEVAARVEAEFGDRPVILKDYVKSRKHEWFDACFIRSAADEAEVRRVASNLLRLQGDALVGGLVFREFVAFERVGLHPKSRMPMVQEFRLFFFDGEPLLVAPYWGEGSRYEGPAPDARLFAPVAARVKSRFFAMDVARKEDGDWQVMELNDGGSAGVPEGGDAAELYAQLARRSG